MIAATELTEAELEQLFTRDPGHFIQSLVLNVRAAGEAEINETVERQRQIFEKWLMHYSNHYRDTIAKSVETRYANRYAGAIATAEARGELNGRIAALSNIPVKKSGFHKVTDWAAVSQTLQELKAVEPIGVTNYAEGTNIQTSN